MPASSHAKAKQLITSVLEYLHGMERFATITNDLRTRQHFEECWVMVWRAYYGGYSVPVALSCLTGHVSVAQVPASKPPWFIAKYTRPTRKVVGRFTEKIPAAKGSPSITVSYDVLECGHRVAGNENHSAAAPARHRRCTQCVAGRSQQEAEEWGDPSHMRKYAER